MIFEQISTGGDRNYGYLIGDEQSKEAAVIDPSYSPDRLVDRAKQYGLTIKYVINTHGHSDHTNGNASMKKATGASVAGYKNTGAGVDVELSDGEVLYLGELELKIIHTPGHTSDSICILTEDKLCTGDTLFVGKVGGTDFGDCARQEYDSLHNKLMVLPGNVEVYPGHNYGSQPTSTIENELETNPFLVQKTFENFVHLKKNWTHYKREHGIS